MYALRELCACISLNRHPPAHPVRDTPSAEHLTVNQGVTGSSPVGGAIKTLENTMFSRVFCYLARSEGTSKNPIFKVSGLTHPTVFGK